MANERKLWPAIVDEFNSEKVSVMANGEQFVRLNASIAHWNQWRQEHPGAIIDLYRADFKGANLSGADLSFYFYQ